MSRQRISIHASSRISGMMSYEEVISEINAKGGKSKSKKLSNKQFLSILRLFCIYCSQSPSSNVFDDILIGSLINIAKDCSDQDVDRKILRTIYSIFYIMAATHDGRKIANKQLLQDIYNILKLVFLNQFLIKFYSKNLFISNPFLLSDSFIAKLRLLIIFNLGVFLILIVKFVRLLLTS